MSTSTYVHVGAYLRVTEKFELKHSDDEVRCPKCKKRREGIFCSDCGTPLETVSKAKVEKTLNPASIVNFLANNAAGEDDFDTDGFLDTFSCPEYIAEGVVVPNYVSRFEVEFDLDDMPAVPIEDMLVERDGALSELREKAKDILALFDRHGVKYQVLYGVVAWAS